MLGTRRYITTMLNMDRGMATTPDNICLTRGSQMAIYLASHMLAGRGDAVVIEAHSYPPARECSAIPARRLSPLRSMTGECASMNSRRSVAR
jgi:GntR family transcriptional regulator/MocR family aminotransferase